MTGNPPPAKRPTADYSAAKFSPYHKKPLPAGSADASTNLAGTRLRDWARWLDENLDIVTGALDKITNFIVGTGISIEPMIRNRSGELLVVVNDRIRRVLLEESNKNSWCRDVNVTGEYTRGEQEWIACRTWLRDGEILMRRVPVRANSRAIPYQIQTFEADHLPFDFLRNEGDERNAVIHGVEKNKWGRPVAYHLYRQNPGDMFINHYGFFSGDVIRVSASEMGHLKFTRRRLAQTRGVPMFHSAILRLDDIAEYEDAHRVAAKAAADIIASVIRSPDMIDFDPKVDGRSWTMDHGQIISDMLPGEEFKWGKPEMPNPDATPFLDDQLRRVAAGFGMGYSTFSGKYDKSFSAARQEQSENWPNVETLRSQFISDFVRPFEYEPALDAAILAGAVNIPRNADPETIYAADYRGPARPTIDDEKQAKADRIVIEDRTDSRHGRIRERGRDPSRVDAEIAASKALDDEYRNDESPIISVNKDESDT